MDALWETDGTAAGTHEIFVAPGRSPNDLSGLDPSGFELFNGEVLFNGKDANGNQQLWETDGTAAGTHELAVAGASPTTGLVPLDLTAIVPLKSSLAEHHQRASVDLATEWGRVDRRRAVSPSPGPSWKAIGTGDFFGGGSTDILWQNASTGQASIWEMSGSTLIGGGPVSANPGPSWQASERAISITTAFPTSCGRTRARSSLDLGNEREQCHRRRPREPQSRAELESYRNRRFQPRRRFRHFVAEHEQRPGFDLGNEREHLNRRRTREPKSRAELGTRSGRAISPTTAFPTTSFFKTPARAKCRSGKCTGPA